jgi:hypothetical protein
MLSSNGLSENEIERLRLALSIFQDGTGWETIKSKKPGGERVYYPGYRQFERVIAEVFGGIAPENKGIFDVFIPIASTDTYCGISCKMRSELDKAVKDDGRVYIEMSNAAGEFMDRVRQKVGNGFQEKPDEVGETLISLIAEWHQNAGKNSGYKVDLAESSFLVLLYNKKLTFGLYQYELRLPNAKDFTWSFPSPARNTAQGSRRLVGYMQNSLAFEWYLHSGGQLKYYPSAQDAKWHSALFELEPLKNRNSGLVSRIQEYFPKKWEAIKD